MIILTIRTDKPEAEIGLFDSRVKLAYEIWQAHRQLAETIHTRIEDLLRKRGLQWDDIEGLIVFQGPGSFTGLRIGLSVANALAASLSIPIVGGQGEEWLEKSLLLLQKGDNDDVVFPLYGAEPHITQQKK
jgi:tRNA threonylcarbamoyladenosine biosynthesis protein TsaB